MSGSYRRVGKGQTCPAPTDGWKMAGHIRPLQSACAGRGGRRVTVVVKDMRRIAIVWLLFAAVMWAANIKLYLKDGGYHLVREYQVAGGSRALLQRGARRLGRDSARSGGFEAHRKRGRRRARAELAHDSQDSPKRRRPRSAIEKETSRIPQGPGVYWLDGSADEDAETGRGVNPHRQETPGAEGAGADRDRR